MPSNGRKQIVRHQARISSEGTNSVGGRARDGLLGLACVCLLGLAALLGSVASAGAAGACPNEALRAESNVDPITGTTFSEELPECRAFEQATPSFKTGGGTGEVGASTDGNRLAFFSSTGFADPPAQSAVTNSYLAERTELGWTTTPLALPAPEWEQTSFIDATSDLSRFAYLAGYTDRHGGRLVLREPDGKLTTVSPLLPLSSAGPPVPTYGGSTADFKHFVLQSKTTLLPDDTTGAGKQSIYETTGTGDDASLKMIAVDDAGALISPLCGASLGGIDPTSGLGSGFNAISADGGTIYFTAQPFTTGSAALCAVPSQRPKEIYARIAAAEGAPAETVRVSTPDCDRPCTATNATKVFEGASRDGSRVFFTTTQQLTNSDMDAGKDLYLYDFHPTAGRPNLIQISAGDSTDPTPGTGAGVLGVTRIADDGSRVYFVATGILSATPNARGEQALAAAPNLYVYNVDTGGTAFIATLSGGASPTAAASDAAGGSSPSGLWDTNSREDRHAFAVGLGSPSDTISDGHILLFTSYEQLTEDDKDTALDVYRYDDTDGSLQRLSISAGGSDGNDSAMDAVIGAPDFGVSKQLRVSESNDDGSLVLFSTNEGLSEGDDNNASDVYAWSNGAVHRISEGRNETGERLSALTTLSGGDIFFSTTQALNPSDVDTAVDTYDARIAGGFPRPSAPPSRCAGETCQGGPSLPPSELDLGTTGGGVRTRTVPTSEFSVKPVSRKARKRFAESGHLLLAVKVSEAGTIWVGASARIGEKYLTVARAGKTVSRAGIAHLSLSLSRLARRALKERGKLTVRVKASYSKAQVTRTMSLKLGAMETHRGSAEARKSNASSGHPTGNGGQS
jgi:hypothetical protein